MHALLMTLASFPLLVVGYPDLLFSREGPREVYHPDIEAHRPALHPNHLTWQPPGECDVRSPCPTLNTLANHGFVPHDGRNITLDVLTKAFKDVLNIAPSLTQGAFSRAVPVNPMFNADFLDLDMLHVHNFIEHDGSLSRKDAVFDRTNSFDNDTFNNLLSYFGNETQITIESMANARARHALEMSEENDLFAITWSQVPVILGENAMMLLVWNEDTTGTPEDPVANRAYYEYFFRNQRLPIELGWSPVDTEITEEAAGKIVAKLQETSPAGVPLAFNPQLAVQSED
ncbi:hypothetical protein CKM354_000215900 [Cercospora kikuchii]|uniref:Heme haloperoxidase family profile domain-containing protein n=1 Tax=Cercospora kikuchii TaxID=84275 RepID=A0A9P3CF02_9PEZI|nr:uncharacterized protein CKM354_000215900 [Cercospora kikuchii]GIZ38755.1 hypothetical protein CKM354_000215900 [Cercospora kikuchii]